MESSRLENISFTLAGFLHGFRLIAPLALGVFAYGLLFGMLAEKQGMTCSESMLMSLSVFAGASQIIVTELWHHPLPAIEIMLTTLAINARHLLMGASLQPWFRKLTPVQAYASLFFCVDEAWALTMKECRKDGMDGAFLAGAGFGIYLAWNASTLLGFFGGTKITNLATYGLDFAFTAAFIALLSSLWRGKRDFLPWLTAAVTAVSAHSLLPGKWYIMIGALVGSSVEFIRHGK